MPPEYMSEFGGSLIAVAAFVSNVFFWVKTDYFATTSELKPMLHTWSLAVEEQYYIFWPLVAVFLIRIGKKTFLAVTAALTIASLGAAQWTSMHDPSASFFLAHTRAWELLIGSLAAFAYLHNWALPDWARHAATTLALTALIGSLSLFSHDVVHPGVLTLIPVAATAIILLWGKDDTFAGKLLSVRPMVWIGLISYSLYLWHQPVFAFARLYLIEYSTNDLLIPMLTCFPLAYLSWRYVERPFRDKRIVSRTALFASSVFMIAMPALAGILFVQSGGFPYRYELAQKAVAEVIQLEKKRRSDGTMRNGCEFARRGRDPQAWLKGWKCPPAGDIRILVVGDSHASDKAWALREAGIQVGQIGSQGCPLVTTTADCHPVYDFAKQLVREGKVDALILAKNYRIPSQAEFVLGGLQSEWGSLGVPILLFTQTPVFNEFELKWTRAVIQGGGQENIRLDERALAEVAQHEQAVKSPNISVLSTRKVLCGDLTSGCNPFEDGHPLVVDSSHLSSFGAKRMARNILADPTWVSWYGSLKPPAIGDPSAAAK